MIDQGLKQNRKVIVFVTEVLLERNFLLYFTATLQVQLLTGERATVPIPDQGKEAFDQGKESEFRSCDRGRVVKFCFSSWEQQGGLFEIIRKTTLFSSFLKHSSII